MQALYQSARGAVQRESCCPTLTLPPSGGGKESGRSMVAMSDDQTMTRRAQRLPWALALAGIAMIALATVGLRALLALLALLGLSAGTNDAVLGGIIIDLIGGGILCLIAGLVLALARSGTSKAAWLIGSGVVLLALGSGPLLLIIVM